MVSMHRAIVEILEGYVERTSALGGFPFHNTLIGVANFIISVLEHSYFNPR
jgi:hypothetical protein